MADTTIYISPDLAAAMDRARSRHKPVPSRSAYGRWLIRRALEVDAEGVEQEVARAAIAGTAEAAACTLAEGREVPVPVDVCADADHEG